MKILSISHRFPWPPDFGSKVRAFHTIKHLAARHEVTVASLARSPEEAEAAKGIAPHCHAYLVEKVSPLGALARMLLGSVTPQPASMAYFHSPALKRRIRDEIARVGFDLIMVHSSSVGPYVEDVAGIPKIIDFGDMDSEKWRIYTRHHRFPRSLIYRLEWAKLRPAEERLARRFDYCTCATPAELKTLEDYDVGAVGGWFPNGVDLEFFQPGDEPYDANEISFVGRMDYFPNQQAVIDFSTNILPRIQARRPGTRFTIVGAHPTAAVRALARQTGVTVTGTVDDVRPYVRRSAINVAPLRIARGTQNKILEAMALGVPVVASDLAAQGVDAVPGEHLLSATTPEDFAERVLSLLDDPAEHRRLAEAGRARVESHHTWPAAMRRLDAIIDDCMARSRPGSIA